jgi:hypothetical protein
VDNANAFTFKPGSVDDFRQKIISLASMSLSDYSVFSCRARDYVLQKYDFVPIAQKCTDLLIQTSKSWRIAKEIIDRNA